MKFTFFISFLLITNIISAQLFTGGAITMDQDFFTPKSLNLNKDQNYTQGFFLTLNGDFAEYIYPLSKPRAFMDRIFKLDRHHLFFVRGDKSTNSYSFSFGGTGFTPQDIASTDVIMGDRPFSSLLLFSSSRTSLRQVLNPSSSTSWKVITSDFTLNIFGLGMAESLQTSIHKAKLKKNPDGRPLPLGWPNQISDGGEPSLMYRVGFTQRLFDYYVPHPDHNSLIDKADYHIFQMSHNVSLSLGYYTYFSTGINMRFGLIRTRIFLKDRGLNGIAGLGNKTITQFKSNTMNSSEAENIKIKRETNKVLAQQFELYFFLSTNASVFLYNGALSGQFRKSNYRMPYGQINPLVFTYDAGIAMNWGYLQLGYALISRSPEFYGKNSRTHTWGSLYLAIQKPLIL